MNTKTQTVGVIFGRFNPPHQGHRAAWQMAANDNDHCYISTNPYTTGPKDPLPVHIKAAAMQAIWPDIKNYMYMSQSWLTLANDIYKRHPDAMLKLYTDEAWVFRTVKQYNGQENNHGFYNFQDIQCIETPRLSSATSLRKAVLENNSQDFENAAGVPANTPIDISGKKIKYFELVKQYLIGYENNLLEKVIDV